MEERRETTLNAALIVKKIVIHKGDLIDGFIFEGVQGGVEKTIMKHGGDGGAELEPWIMKENEYISMISGTGDGGDTMSSLTFDTNLRKGTYGTPNRQTFEFKAEEGHMIVGVKGPSGFCPKITDIVTEPCPWEHSVCEAIPITGPFLDALTILRTLSTDFQPHEHDTLLQSGLFECIEKLIERAKSTKYGKDELSAASWQFLELLVSRLVGAANEGQLSPAATHLLTSLTHQLSSAASALSSFDAARAAVPELATPVGLPEPKHVVLPGLCVSGFGQVAPHVPITRQYSLAFFVCPTKGGGRIFSKGGERYLDDDEKAAPFSNFRLSLSNSMHLVYEASIGPDKTFSVCSSNTKLTALKWTHVALVQSNETVTFYIDGDCGWFLKAAIHPSMSCRLLISNPTTCLGLGEKDFESALTSSYVLSTR